MLSSRWTAAAVSLLAAAIVGASLLLASRSDAAIDGQVEVAGTTQLPAAGPDDAVTRAALAVVSVESYSCGELHSASGFVTADGLVTAGHLVASTNNVVVRSGNGIRGLVAAVQNSSSGLDLAVAELAPTTTKVPWSTSELRPDESVTVVARTRGEVEVFPASVQLRASGSTWGFEGDIVVLDRQVAPGYSGSPVLNQRGEVAAMVVAVDTATGVTLAVPADQIVDWLGSVGANTDDHRATACAPR